MVVTRLGSSVRNCAGRGLVENPGPEEPSWAPSTAFTVEALTRRGDPPRPTFSLPGLGMVTPEARAKWRGPARPNAASASKKVSAVEPSEADAIVILCKEDEADFCDIYKDLDRFDKVQKLRTIFFKLHTNNEEQMKIALRNPPCITFYTESCKNHFFNLFTGNKIISIVKIARKFSIMFSKVGILESKFVL